ncbi:UNC93-like protein 1 isoform X2 [Mangifera indica]|uniref:UNC93-like protein 1 isoform X2 n=1 Tax=Mangifera indica TaxID=29780 RepID=UPI001CF9E8F8|nr:UNC93-like protein 1 isoform X2 [Mangifera indica]
MGTLNPNEESAQPIRPTSRFRCNSPITQVCLIGVICFCCPGMYSALSGMGGGGQVNPEAADNANTALYSTFAIFSILGGGIYNLLGPRVTLLFACPTYTLYAGAFLYYNHYQHQLFPIVAGALLGVGAGFLWAAEGAIMTSYPPPNRKGTYISIFWTIFSTGGVVGGLIPFILNYNRHDDAASLNDTTYIGFMCFMSAGALLSLAILPPRLVVRDDGSRCTNINYSSVTTEATEIAKLFLNWRMLLLVPPSWASNFFYSYQFNNVNAALFNLRTRALTSVFYWAAQMVGSVGIGYVLDFSFESRRKRGLVGIGVVALLGTAIWGGGLANQLTYSHPKTVKLDFKDSGADFAGPFVLYFSYGMLDAMFQSMVYWVIGALANDSETLSRYTGFFKGVQSAGAAVAWQIDTQKP